MRKYILLFILSIFLLNFNSNIYANEVASITLEDEAKLLTNFDDLNINDITDGSNENANFSIQDYANSYIDMLFKGEELFFIPHSDYPTQLEKNKYGGNINYDDDKDVYIAINNDAIIKIIPQKYFTTEGEHTYFGLEYGFYINTYKKENVFAEIVEPIKIQTHEAYVSDVFVIDYSFEKPISYKKNHTMFKVKPLFSARYYTINELKSYSNIVISMDTLFGENGISISEAYDNDIITISNLSYITPKYNMSNLIFASKIENKESLNQNDLNYDVYKDDGLFINEFSMEYKTYEISIDNNTYSTNGFNLYDLKIKNKYNPFQDITSYFIGKIPYIDEVIPFLDEYELLCNLMDGYTSENYFDIEISCKTIESNNLFYILKDQHISNYGRLLKDIMVDIKSIDSNLTELDLYNCNEFTFKIYYSQNYLNIQSPSTNTIGLSFDIVDVNSNSNTKIHITDIIKYNIFNDLDLSNDNMELLSTNADNYYNFILEVDYSGTYSIIGTPFAISTFSILGLPAATENQLTDISIYEINEHNIDENNKLALINNTFVLNSNKKYLMEVKSEVSWILKVGLTVQAISNFEIQSGDCIKFNYFTSTRGNYLFELNKSNLDIIISKSNNIIESNTINNSNYTNELFELEENVIYKISITNNSLGKKSNLSLKIKANLIICNEQKMIETYLNKDSTCTIIYTAQNDERISISTSGLLDTEYIEIIVEENNSYQYDADYIDEENDIYDPNASLNVELKAGESIIITINEYYGSSGTLFIHVAVTTL